MEEANNILPLDKVQKFHKDLNTVLKKYGLDTEDGNVSLTTSKTSIALTGIPNCKKGCLAWGPHTDVTGKIVVGYYCGC